MAHDDKSITTSFSLSSHHIGLISFHVSSLLLVSRLVSVVLLLRLVSSSLIVILIRAS